MRLRASEKRDGKSEVITHSLSGTNVIFVRLDFTRALIKTVLRYTSFQSAPIFPAIVWSFFFARWDVVYIFYATEKKA